MYMPIECMAVAYMPVAVRTCHQPLVLVHKAMPRLAGFPTVLPANTAAHTMLFSQTEWSTITKAYTEDHRETGDIRTSEVHCTTMPMGRTLSPPTVSSNGRTVSCIMSPSHVTVASRVPFSSASRWKNTTFSTLPALLPKTKHHLPACPWLYWNFQQLSRQITEYRDEETQSRPSLFSMRRLRGSWRHYSTARAALGLPSGLPAARLLSEEGLNIVALGQRPNALQLLVVNLMPLKEETERQLARSLGQSPYDVVTHPLPPSNPASPSLRG